jgi:hypothetical protein
VGSSGCFRGCLRLPAASVLGSRAGSSVEGAESEGGEGVRLAAGVGEGEGAEERRRGLEKEESPSCPAQTGKTLDLGR